MQNSEKIQEELDDSNIKFLKYFSVIDSTEILENNRAMMSYLFPQVKMQKLLQWYSPVAESSEYQNKDIRSKLESICSRFYGDGTLKVLYRSLNQLISMTYMEPDKVSHDKDIVKLIKKISIYIQQRLTDSDKEAVEKLSSAFETVASTISDKIDSIVLNSMNNGKEEPEEKESEKETSDAPKGEEGDVEEPKKENKISEYYKRRLSKKIREMVRTAVIEKKIKKFDRKA
jgi:hypothetical protein